MTNTPSTAADLAALEAQHRTAGQAHILTADDLAAQVAHLATADRKDALTARINAAQARLDELEGRAARDLQRAELAAIRAGHAYREAAEVAARIRAQVRGDALELARLQGRLAPHDQMNRMERDRAEDLILTPLRAGSTDGRLTLRPLLGAGQVSSDLGAHAYRWDNR